MRCYTDHRHENTGKGKNRYGSEHASLWDFYQSSKRVASIEEQDGVSKRDVASSMTILETSPLQPIQTQFEPDS